MTTAHTATQTQWQDDGVGCGGHYLHTNDDRIYAGVHEIGGLNASGIFDCSIWTPGCGFNPQTTRHENIEEAKAHAAKQLCLLSPSFKAALAKATGGA